MNPAAVSALLDDHRDGRRDAGDAIWALLNLELWYRTFVDGEGVQTLPAISRGAAVVRPAAEASLSLRPAQRHPEPGQEAARLAPTRLTEGT